MNGTFKSNSHDDLRTSSRKEPFGLNSNSRGKESRKDSPQEAAGSSTEPFSRPQSTSQQQTPFSEQNFLGNDWTAAFQFKNLSDALPTNDSSQRQPNPQRARSPRKQNRPGVRARPTPQQASVASEAEEAESTVNGDDKGPEVDGEAMDLDDESPAQNTQAAPQKPNDGKETAAPASSKPQPAPKARDQDAGTTSFNLKNFGGVFPFTSTNSGGLGDLKDMSSTLPFESRAKVPKTTPDETNPRDLKCPNPPKRPEPPQPVQASAGNKQVAITRAALDRYIAEMNAYVREWNSFDGHMVGHFRARHETNQTEMAPNWLGAVGDSLRLDEDAAQNSGDESDDDNSGSTARRGFTSYKNALVQDEKVMKHWEVARERHLECMLQFGEMRKWIRGGGKIL